jgi:hypothetical protein
MTAKIQEPSVGRIVHFVYGGQHVPAIITDPAFRVVADGREVIEQAMTVFLPAAEPFTTVAMYAGEVSPGTWLDATWHWPEYVPAKD